MGRTRVGRAGRGPPGQASTAAPRLWGEGGHGVSEKQKDQASPPGGAVANKNVYLLRSFRRLDEVSGENTRGAPDPTSQSFTIAQRDPA